MDTINWNWFLYSELFDIRKGKRLTKADMTNGNIPYIGATDSNNGITAYISNNEHLHKPCTISVSYNGSIAEAYYQTKPYWATDDVNVLYPKFHMNKYIAMFLVTLINKEKYRFNYGRKWDKDSMLSSKIKLPTTNNNSPDWNWIERYVKERLLPSLPHRARMVWQKEYCTQPLQQATIHLSDREWKKIKLSEVFIIKLTKGDIKSNRTDNGSIPLISSSETNNGLVKCITKEGDGLAETFPSNTITLDMFCHAYYQPIDYFAVGHGRVNILIPTFPLNKYIGIFITTIIGIETYRFSYGRAVYSNVAEELVIRLPVVPNSHTPDWQFMEDYIKSLPYSRNI